MRKMKILLVEDDKKHCLEYKEYVSKTGNVSLYIANEAEQGIELVKKITPDVVLLDLELHGSGGDGINFLQTMNLSQIEELPYVIVITNNASMRTYEMARKYGTDYIIPKFKPDYSPKFVVSFAYQYFKIKNTSILKKPPKKRENLLKGKIIGTIECLGITNDMIGREYLIESIIIALDSKEEKLNLKADVYAQIAQKYHKSDYSIEKAIDTAIKKAWRNTDFDTLAKNYTAEVSYSRGSPTNAELIYYLRDKVKA